MAGKGKGTHRLIGRAGIDYRMLGEEEIIEMGYVIAPEYQRQGYAYEVCQAIMAWAKSNLDFRRIDCLVEPGNEASLGLLHKLGFQETEKINQDGKYSGISGILSVIGKLSVRRHFYT